MTVSYDEVQNYLTASLTVSNSVCAALSVVASPLFVFVVSTLILGFFLAAHFHLLLW